LQHGHFGSLLRNVRKQGDSCCTASDDNHILPSVIEVFRPELRVDNLTLEFLKPWDCGLQWLTVVIVPGAENDERPPLATSFAVLKTSLQR
jgi:hypothetical protein